jgi:hypothetical protein
MHVDEMCYPSCHTWLLSLLITEGHHWVPFPVSHSPNPHTNLLNVFIQIANNKGYIKKKYIKNLHLSLLKLFKTLYVSASIGHPQVLKLFFKRIAVVLVIHAFSSLYLLCALFLVVCLLHISHEIGD